MNRLHALSGALLLTNAEASLDEARVQKHFASIQSLTAKIAAQPENAMLYFARSLDEYLVQDFEKALADADRAVALDSTFVLAYYLRAQVQMKALGAEEEKTVPSSVQMSSDPMAGWEFNASRAGWQAALDDLDKVLGQEPEFAACYYNKGNIYVQLKMWPEAIAAYTKAVELNAAFAEAYYNRGVAYILSGDYAKAIADLSQAGEMGLYKAYNLMKRYRAKALSQKD